MSGILIVVGIIGPVRISELTNVYLLLKSNIPSQKRALFVRARTLQNEEVTSPDNSIPLNGFARRWACEKFRPEASLFCHPFKETTAVSTEQDEHDWAEGNLHGTSDYFDGRQRRSMPSGRPTYVKAYAEAWDGASHHTPESQFKAGYDIAKQQMAKVNWQGLREYNPISNDPDMLDERMVFALFPARDGDREFARVFWQMMSRPCRLGFVSAVCGIEIGSVDE